MGVSDALVEAEAESEADPEADMEGEPERDVFVVLFRHGDALTGMLAGERAPDALVGILSGQNFGKLLIRVGPDPI